VKTVNAVGVGGPDDFVAGRIFVHANGTFAHHQSQLVVVVVMIVVFGGMMMIFIYRLSRLGNSPIGNIFLGSVVDIFCSQSLLE
jgi:hypothetical protein